MIHIFSPLQRHLFQKTPQREKRKLKLMNGRYGRFHHTRCFLHRSIRCKQHRNPHLLPPSHHPSPRFLRFDNNIVILTTERRTKRTQIQADVAIRVVVNHHFAHIRCAHPRGNPDHIVFDLNLRAKLLTTAETEVLPRFHGIGRAPCRERV